MKKETIKAYDKPAVIELLEAKIKEAGSQKQFALDCDVYPSQLSDALKGFRQIPAPVLAAVGLRARIVYVPVEVGANGG